MDKELQNEINKGLKELDKDNLNDPIPEPIKNLKETPEIPNLTEEFLLKSVIKGDQITITLKHIKQGIEQNYSLEIEEYFEIYKAIYQQIVENTFNREIEAMYQEEIRLLNPMKEVRDEEL